MRDISTAVDSALAAALDDVGHALVRVGAEGHREDVQAAIGAFALDGLDATKKREVHVALRMPSQSEMLKLVAGHLREQGAVQTKEDAASAFAQAQQKLEPYFHGEAAKAWAWSVEHGDTTVVFEGMPHDCDHSLNRAYADIQAGSSRIAGLAEGALAKWMPEASPQERQNANVPQNRNRLMAVNDCVLLNYQEQDIDLKAKFAHAVELAEAHGSLPDSQTPLHAYIKIGTLNQTPTTLRVNNLHQATCGTGYFDKADLPPDGALRAALLHEQAHVTNGDLATPELQYMHALSGLGPVRGRSSIGKMHPDLIAVPLLSEVGGDVAQALQEVQKLNGQLNEIKTAVRPVYEALEQAEWLPQLSGDWAANDMEGENRILQTIAELPQCAVPSEAADGFVERCSELLRVPETEVQRQPEANVAQVREALQHMYAAHEDLFDGLSAIAKLAGALNHATEFRADDRAAESLENPADLEAMLHWAGAGRDTAMGSFTHPSIDSRGERQRERPVLGKATAALAEQASRAEERGI